MLKLTLVECSVETAEIDVTMIFVGEDTNSLRDQLVIELSNTASDAYARELLSRLDAANFAVGSEIVMENGPLCTDAFRVAAL